MSEGGHAHQGHRERMRERFLQNGLTGFAPHEALEFLLMFAVPRRDVNPLAHLLIRHFGSLKAVLSAPPEALAQVPGVGAQAAALLALVVPLSHLAAGQTRSARPVIDTLQRAKAYCAPLFHGAAEEVLYVICLDARGRVLRAVPAVSGTIDEIAVYPRVVVSAALRHGAHSVLLAHNHPSGAAEPSGADLAVTARLRAALHAVDIRLWDHLICAEGVCASIDQWEKARAGAPPARARMRAADAGGDARPSAGARRPDAEDV